MGMAAGGNAAGAVPAPPPSEDAIAQLTAMGFGRAQAEAALRRTHNNVEFAVQQLVG